MSTDPPLSSLCTVEFLVRENEFWFIEANPRLAAMPDCTEETAAAAGALVFNRSARQ